MGHFDATHLLEIQEREERELTVHEQETLHGCKLIHSMIHDLDSNLTNRGTLRTISKNERTHLL